MSSKAKKLQEIVSKYAKYHVNPDLYTIAATKDIPQSIKRPPWLIEATPKYSFYDSLLLRECPKEIASSLELT